MTPGTFTEDQLVEQPAIELFEELGWDHVNAFYETLGPEGTLGRDNKSEVFLVRRLRQALERLNPGMPAEAIEDAVVEITKPRTAMHYARANAEIHALLRDRVEVSVRQPDGTTLPEKLTVIDWENPENNDFLLVSQLWVHSDLYHRRTDLVGFVNGIPLVFIELKASHRNLKHAYDDNLSDYRDAIPHLFIPNGFLVLSNGAETKVGTITSGWEFFSEWKKINSEGEEGVVSLETVIRGMCTKERVLDLIENFVAFQDAPGGFVKLLARNHQYLGVNNALARMQELRDAPPEERGKLGVFWHTQGSGKTLSMLFFSQKVLRKIPGNWSFVIVTDREDLDDQAHKEFLWAGVVTEKHVRATGSAHLRQLLGEDHRYVFTLIQKFRTEKGAVHPVVSERDDVIVITDEAHRTQYDILALNMRNALPNASFLGFTGTPLIAGEERTREVFGEYVSIYNFAASTADHATVPLYYENRIPQLQIANPTFGDDLMAIVEEADLDEAQERQLARALGQQYELITRDDRLEAVAKDIVEHFLGRGFPGKGLVVSIDKVTAVRTFEKVQRFWAERLAANEARLASGGPEPGRARPRVCRDRVHALDGHGRGDLAVPERDRRDGRTRHRHQALPQADRRGEARGEVQGPPGSVPARVRLLDVDDRVRRSVAVDRLSRQAAAQPHPDADDHPRQPRLPREEQRPDRRLRRRLPQPAEGAGDLRDRRQGRRGAGRGEGRARRRAASRRR